MPHHYFVNYCVEKKSCMIHLSYEIDGCWQEIYMVPHCFALVKKIVKFTPRVENLTFISHNNPIF